MLQQSNFNSGDVVTIKLVSGEEIIGYYVEDTMSHITLRKPLVPVQTETGMGLAPYIMSSNYLREGDGKIPFNKMTVVSSIKTGKEFGNAFTQQVSGLDMSSQPKTGIIT
jgi:hypothetical protein